MDVELKKDINKEAINKMCMRNEKDDIQLICFPSAESLLKFAGKFQIICGQKYGNALFTKIWRRNLQQAISDNELTLNNIFQTVWQPCIKECRMLLQSLMDLTMKLSDVDSVLEPHRAHLETQLKLLVDGMTEISIKFDNPSLIDRAYRRVREYWNLRQYQKGADTFLRLKDSLGLAKGDFQLVERLSQKVYEAKTKFILLFTLVMCTAVLLNEGSDSTGCG